MTLLDQFDLPALSELLGKLGADGWLLYDFHGINPAATRVLGIRGMGTRRFFVLLPRDGKPVAIAHRIELASFDGFPGEVRPYAAWRELHDQLQRSRRSHERHCGGAGASWRAAPRFAKRRCSRV